MKIAYVMSRFPKHTETFILNEMLAVEEQGVPVAVYPLLKQRDAIVHQEAHALIDRAHYMPFISLPILASNLGAIRRNPWLYFRTFFEVIRGTLGNMNFLVGAISLFPKAVHFSKLMSDEKVTHIHAHFSNHPAVVSLVAHRLTDIPFSFTAHGHDIHIDRTMLREKIVAAAFAVTVSRYNKDLMASECPAGADGKIHVVHCGVDTRVFKINGKPVGKRGGVNIICVASLLEVKGHIYLIQACKLLKERGLDFTCHLVGEGNYRARLEKEIGQYGLDDCVKLHGACSQSQVRELLMAADIFVLASIPTRRGAREGIPELVENGISGFLTPPGDVTSLANNIGQLVADDALRRKMGTAARETILREFNLESNARLLIRMFKGIHCEDH